MPLVSQNIITHWYRKDSWVYRNVAFLYQNPLWNRQIPKGFSLCPLFWSALFSLFIFRPFAYTAYGFGRMAKALKLGRVIKWTDSIVNCVILFPSPPPSFVPTFIGVSLIFCLSMIILALVSLALEYAAAGIISALLLPLLVFGAFIASAIYIEKRGTQSRCPVEIYSRITTTLSVIVAFVLHPNYAVWSFFGIPAEAVKSLWHGIVNVSTSLWHGITWVTHWISTATIGLIPLLPAVAFLLVAAAIYGYVAMRMMNKAVLNAANNTSPVVDRKEYQRKLMWIASVLEDVQYEMEGSLCFFRTEWNNLISRIPVACDLALNTPFLDLSRDKIREILPEAIAWMNDYQEKRRTRQAAWDARCCAITSVLVKFFAPVTAVWKQIRIFFAMLWQVAKARKQGFCPYLTFTDPK